MDVDVRYRAPAMPIGQFAFSIDGTYVLDYALSGVNGTLFPGGAGQRGSLIGAISRWRHYAALDWSRGPWAATLANSFHTGWPTTQLVFVPGSSEGPVQIGSRNAGRYDDFNSLDLRITRTFTMARGQLDVFIEATNLASRANPCCTEYSLTSDAQGNAVLQSETDDWLPLVPSFGVLWRYGK
jgi:hypothetical protein